MIGSYVKKSDFRHICSHVGILLIGMYIRSFCVPSRVMLICMLNDDLYITAFSVAIRFA